MKKLLVLAASLMLAIGASAQGQQMMTPIPADKDVRVGKLENGMSYYIRHNEKPKGQADFYILHDVGAIQENDAQQGLAHFLEHMAFNGTKNLPGKQLTEYLEKVGVKFGANLNANTGWDVTRYLIKDVPTLREGIIDSALLILHDWSHFISLEPQEIDSERGVIMEELRTTDGAGWRSTINMIKALGKGSKYENRNLIGYLDGLKNFTYQELKDFYNQWYRPDYQAIVIVGDLNVDAVEAKIKSLMSDIPAPKADASQKEKYVVPDNQEPIISIYTDKEMQGSAVNLIIKRAALPDEINNTQLREMMDLMFAYISTMGKNRLTELAMKPDAPFLGASIDIGNLGIIPTMDCTAFMVQTQDGKLLKGFEAICTEIEKIRRHGFTQGEFDRAQENLLRSGERQYTNRNDRTNSSFVQTYMNNYLDNSPMPDAQTEWQMDSTLLKMISLEMVNKVAAQLITPHNRVVTVTAPAKDSLVTPTAQEFLDIMTKMGTQEVAAYEDTLVKEPLIAAGTQLKGSPVKKTTYNQAYGTTEWTLANGVRVIVKPTKFKADEISMNASSEGGSSSLSDADYYACKLLPTLGVLSGVSKFSNIELRKQLTGKVAAVATSINDYSCGMSGSCSPKDLETMFQLVYLNFTAPRFDQNDFNTLTKMMRAQLENMKSNPDYQVQERLVNTIYNNNFRRQMMSVEILDQMKLEQFPAIYNTFFSSIKGFTFTFVGNVDLDLLKPLVEKYLGSIPSKGKALTFVDDHVRNVEGKVTEEFKTPMQQPKVSVHYYFSGKMDYTLENKMALTFLTQALNSRYLVSIREEKGGTYGVRVSGSTDFRPEQTYDLHISFDTNEAMADELGQIVLAEIQEIAEKGPKSEDIEKTREFFAKSWKNGLEQNGNWMSYIQDLERYKIDYLADYERVLKALTAEDVRLMAKKLLSDGNLVNVVMRPEAAAAPEAAESKK